MWIAVERRRTMAALPLAIHGHGILPGLLAVHLLQRRPSEPILLLSADSALGGQHLEPVVASRLSDVARDLIDPFVVSCWPAYYLVEAGVTDRKEDEVLLLDPVQVWLDLNDRLDPAVMVAPCGAIALIDDCLSWTGGSARIDRLVDLDPLRAGPTESEIVGIDAARQLTLPVLADFDAGCADWAARQYLPLGDERLVVRKLPHPAHLIGVLSAFETILNGITSA